MREIKPEDLRIGNFIETYLGIQKVTSKEIMLLDSGACLDEKPIPITEEWLIEKFGFIYIAIDPSSTLKKGFNEYQKGRIKILETSNGYEIFIKGAFFIIKYVHQLQNLYHSLTGEELEPQNKELKQ